MQQVKSERNHTRDTRFGNHLRSYGLVCSRWLRELSLTRRNLGYDVPSIDVDSMLYDRTTGDLLAIFETKRGDEMLSRAEHEVLLDLANKCQTPAFILRYWNDNDSWLIKPEPMNGYATEFTNNDVQLDWMGFEDFLSDLGWQWFIPDDHETPMNRSLFFPMAEFDRFKVKSLVDFRPIDLKVTQEDATAPEFKLWSSIGDACEVPALSVVFEPTLGWFKTYPLNGMALELCDTDQCFSENEMAKFLYSLHGRSMPAITGLRSYRPSLNQRCLPPTPASYQINRRLYLDVRNQK